MGSPSRFSRERPVCAQPRNQPRTRRLVRKTKRENAKSIRKRFGYIDADERVGERVGEGAATRKESRDRDYCNAETMIQYICMYERAAPKESVRRVARARRTYAKSPSYTTATCGCINHAIIYYIYLDISYI